MIKSKWAYYDAKQDAVFINGDAILPNTSGMSWKQHCAAYDEAFAMSYEERIEKFANPIQKEDILQILSEHEGCKISEFTNVRL